MRFDETTQAYRIGNASNKYQGDYKKVLAVCSGGLLRSPTIAHILASPPYNYNTRSAGTNKSYALTLLDDTLLRWADEIVCTDFEHEQTVHQLLSYHGLNNTPVVCLQIPDIYEYRDPVLVDLIIKGYEEYLKGKQNES